MKTAKTAIKSSTGNHGGNLRAGLKLKTHVQAGGRKMSNHNETLRGGLKLKTHVQAGGRKFNHSETLIAHR